MKLQGRSKNNDASKGCNLFVMKQSLLSFD